MALLNWLADAAYNTFYKDDKKRLEQSNAAYQQQVQAHKNRNVLSPQQYTQQLRGAAQAANNQVVSNAPQRRPVQQYNPMGATTQPIVQNKPLPTPQPRVSEAIRANSAVSQNNGIKLNLGYLNPFGSEGLYGVKQQQGFSNLVKPVVNKLEEVQKNIDSGDDQEGFQWSSPGDYARFGAKLIPGMAQGVLEAPEKIGSAMSGQRVRDDKAENINGIQRIGTLADGVISTAGLFYGASATFLKSLVPGVKTAGLQAGTGLLNKLATGAWNLAKDSGKEGLEEVVQTFATDLADDGKVNTDLTQYRDAATMGALGGAMFHGAGKTINYTKTIPSKVDAGIHTKLAKSDPNYQTLVMQHDATTNQLERTVLEQKMAQLRQQAVTSLPGKVVDKAKQKVDEAQLATHNRTLEHPEVAGIKTEADNLILHRQALISRGLSPNSPAVKAVDNAIRQQGKLYNEAYKRVYESQKQGGYIRVGYPDAKDLPADVRSEIEKGTNFSPKTTVQDRIKNNKLTASDVPKAQAYGFTQAEMRELAKNVPDFKNNPVMTYNPEGKVGTKNSYSNDVNYEVKPTFEYESNGTKFSFDAERFIPYLSRPLLADLKAGEQVDFSQALKKGNNKIPSVTEYKPGEKLPDSLDVPKQDLIIKNGEGKAMSIGEEKYPGLVDEILNAPNAREASQLAEQRGIWLELSDAVLNVMKRDRGTALDIINNSKPKGDYIKKVQQPLEKKVQEAQAEMDKYGTGYINDIDRAAEQAKAKARLDQAKEALYQTSESNLRYGKAMSVEPKQPEVSNTDPIKQAQRIAQKTEALKKQKKITPNDEGYWTTPVKGQAKDPIPNVKDVNGVQVKEGDTIEFEGLLGGKGRSKVTWQEPQIANATGELMPGQWIGNGTLNDKLPFEIVNNKPKPTLQDALAGKSTKVAPKPLGETQQQRVQRALDPQDKLQYKNLNAKERALYKEAKDASQANQSASQPAAQPASTQSTVQATSVETKATTPIPQETKSTQTKKSSQTSKKDVQTTQRGQTPRTETSSLKNQKATVETSYLDDTPENRAKQAPHEIGDALDKHLGHKGIKNGDYTPTKRINDNFLRKGANKIGEGLQRMANSDNKAARSVPRMLQYIYKNAGQDPRIIKAAKRFYGEGNYIDSALLDLGNKAYEYVPNAESRARVHAVLDPEGAVGTPYAKMNMKKLTPQERKATAMLRDLGEAINDTSYRLGEISQSKWESNKGGKYIARMYQDIENSKDLVKEVGISENDAKQLFKGMYKTRVELNDALREQMIRDPVKLAVIRARQVRENAALVDYVKTAEDAGYVSDVKKDGWVKVPYDTAKNGKMFMSKYAGKYMRRDVYENINGYTSSSEAVRAMNNLLDIYDGLPPRRLRKKMLTVYNPIVRTGNVTSNYLFAYLNGINPVTFTKNKVWAKEQLGNSWYPGQPKSEMKGKDPLFIAAQKSGLIGSDIVRSDRNMFKAAEEFGREIDTNSGDASTWTKARRGADVVTQRYGQADDISKLSAVKTWVDRGYSVEEAIEKTSRGFQDYSRVGHMFDMGAKSPIFGNAFIRFQGDLWAGILRNAAIDHPLRLAALPIATYALGQTLSAAAGESEEDKKTREGRVGAPKIPFTDISTEFQTPWGAVDASRFMGVYTRQDLDGNSITDELSRMLPFNIFDPTKLSTKEGQTDAMQKAASDPLIGPLISMMFDVDWRSKSISDPDGVRNGEKLFPEDELSNTEKWINRAQYAARQYMPYPYKEAEDIYSSITERMRNEQSERGGKNDPRKPGASIWEKEGYNSDGSKKNTIQSIARLLGLRVEQFGKDEATTYRDRQQMFDFFDKTDDWKKSLDTETRRKFESRHKSTATRSGIPEDFVDDPFYKYRNASDLKDDKLFEAEKNYAKMQNEYDGKPIDPLFNLRKDHRLRVLWKNSLPPGASDPDVSRMYDEEWYQNFRIEQDHFYSAKTEYNKKRGFDPNVDSNPYPTPDAKMQGLVNFYYGMSSGDRTRWRNAHPDLYQSMKDQWAKQDEWKNRERAQIGLGPLDDKTTTKSTTAGSTGTRTARTARSTRSTGSRSSSGSGSKSDKDIDIDSAKVAMGLKVPKTEEAPNVQVAKMKQAKLQQYRVANGKSIPIKVSGRKRIA